MEDTRSEISAIARLQTVVVIDVETSGLSPGRHSIVEIGAVALADERQQFEVRCRMWPGALWDVNAARVNGQSRAACEDPARPTEAQAVEMLSEWLRYHWPTQRLTVAGMNPRFDLEFLLAASDRSEADPLERIFSHRTLDMHSLAVAVTAADLRDLHTDGIYQALGLPPEPKPHRALAGALAEREALLRLLDRQCRCEEIDAVIRQCQVQSATER